MVLILRASTDDMPKGHQRTGENRHRFPNFQSLFSTLFQALNSPVAPPHAPPSIPQNHSAHSSLQTHSCPSRFATTPTSPPPTPHFVNQHFPNWLHSNPYSSNPPL